LPSSCGQIFQSLRMSLNRSQCGGCSTKYDTPTGTKVVYRRFCASTLLCMFVKTDEEGWHWTLCTRTKVSSLIRGTTGDEPPVRSKSGYPRFYPGGRAFKRSGQVTWHCRTRIEALKVSLRVTSMDSDLEAFSRNPSDGSFAPLASRPSTRTTGPNLRFLSY
jgi:hypothetical protein